MKLEYENKFDNYNSNFEICVNLIAYNIQLGVCWNRHHCKLDIQTQLRQMTYKEELNILEE